MLEIAQNHLFDKMRRKNRNINLNLYSKSPKNNTANIEENRIWSFFGWFFSFFHFFFLI